MSPLAGILTTWATVGRPPRMDMGAVILKPPANPEAVHMQRCGANPMLSILDHVLDGRNGNLDESDDVLRVLATSGNGHVTKYAYRGFRFTVERGRLMWWCHSGYSRPGSLMCIEHEAGWGSLTHRAVVRKITRSIRKDERQRGRRYETGGTW